MHSVTSCRAGRVTAIAASGGNPVGPAPKSQRNRVWNQPMRLRITPAPRGRNGRPAESCKVDPVSKMPCSTKRRQRYELLHEHSAVALDYMPRGDVVHIGRDLDEPQAFCSGV